MTPGAEPISEAGAWGHPPTSVCDGTCQPESNGRELWHHRTPETVVLERHRDTVSGSSFRDDLIDSSGCQVPGTVAWRLQVNDEIAEASLVEMERFLADQLERVRSTMADLGAVLPRQRRA